MKTLLLVDDEPENLRSLGEILNRLGYEVITKPDAQSALSVIRERASVDLVITDYRMPEIDGLEFLILLKQLLPNVPVVMLTAYGAVDTYLKSLSLGVFEYVSKPVRAKELGKIVRAALESAEQALFHGPKNGLKTQPMTVESENNDHLISRDLKDSERIRPF